MEGNMQEYLTEKKAREKRLAIQANIGVQHWGQAPEIFHKENLKVL